MTSPETLALIKSAEELMEQMDCEDRERLEQIAADLRVLLDAIETMDQKITPYGEREDGTILHYIVADSTWHRVLAAARNPRWPATPPSKKVAG